MCCHNSLNRIQGSRTYLGHVVLFYFGHKQYFRSEAQKGVSGSLSSGKHSTRPSSWDHKSDQLPLMPPCSKVSCRNLAKRLVWKENKNANIYSGNTGMKNSLPFRLKLLTPICETFWKYFWRCILGRWYTGGRSGPLWLIFGLFCWNSSFDKGIPDFPSWPHFINSTDQYAWLYWKWTVWINSSRQFKTNPHHFRTLGLSPKYGWGGFGSPKFVVVVLVTIFLC